MKFEFVTLCLLVRMVDLFYVLMKEFFKIIASILDSGSFIL